MTTFRYFSLILMAALMCACSSPGRDLLARADAVMEENPDSALTILEHLDSRELGKSDLPYYALLMTQAQVKTDIPVASDSLISSAYREYADARSGDRGIRSNFYMGEVLFNQDKSRDAMRYYLTAYEESKRLDNPYWHAKAAERIADLFFNAYNYYESEKYSAEAALDFKKAGRQINHRYTLAQMAIIYLNNSEEARAFELLDSLNAVCANEHPADSSFLDYIRPIMLEAGVESGKIDIKYFDRADLSQEDMSYRQAIDVAILESRIYGDEDREDEYKGILGEVRKTAATDEDKLHVIYAQYQNAVAHGDDKFALSLVDSLLDYYTAVAENVVKESVAAAQRDFYSDRSVILRKQASTYKMTLYLIILLSAVVVGFLLVVFHLRNKARKAELESNIEALLSIREFSEKILHEKESLSVALEEKDRNEMRHALIVERLFKEKWSALDMLFSQYFSKRDSGLNDMDFFSNMEKEIKRIASKKGLSEIVDAVDMYMGGVITRLREQCSFLSEQDINFLALIYAGFSVRSVCMFTGMRYQHFYVKKSRLVKRIQDSDALDRQLFISKIN